MPDPVIATAGQGVLENKGGSARVRLNIDETI